MPAFSRETPSICTQDAPRSSRYAGIAFATVRRLPATSTTSPISRPSFSMSEGSSRATARPTSLLRASATRNFSAPLFFWLIGPAPSRLA